MVELRVLSRALLLAASGVLLLLGLRTYRTHRNPIGRSFSALLALLGATALCLGSTAATGVPNKLIWLFTNLSIPVALLAFAFHYYGIALFRSRARTAVVVTPAVLGFVGTAVLVLGTATKTMRAEAPIAALAALPGAAFEIATAFDRLGYYYTVAVVLVAVGVVAVNVVRYEHLDTRLAVLVAVVGVWPWVGNFLVPDLTAAYSDAAGLAVLSLGYATSASLAGLLVGPLGLFASSPAAGNVGPERVLDSMDDPVIIADDQGRLLRLNGAACATFGMTETAAVGQPLGAVIGRDDFEESGPVELETVDGRRQFAVTRSVVADSNEYERGRVFVLRDVTQKQRREQRLEVLNRVLRHNLRNSATSIIGRAQLLSNGRGDEQSAERIVQTTQNLVGIAESARDIERMLAATGTEETSNLAAVVDAVFAEVGAAFPEVELTAAVDTELRAAASPAVLETVLAELVENAAKHNDAEEPIVVVSADRPEPDTLKIAVSDNGPGIPEHERDVLDNGGENQLEHGSGLGLWAVQWGLTHMGGTLSIADTEPRGTTATVTVPAVDGTARAPGESELTA